MAEYNPIEGVARASFVVSKVLVEGLGSLDDEDILELSFGLLLSLATGFLVVMLSALDGLPFSSTNLNVILSFPLRTSHALDPS